MTSRWLVSAAFGLAALVALPTAAIAWRHGFDGLYGQDSWTYIDYALGPLRQALASLQPPPPFFWPPGYPLLVSSLASLTGLGDPAGQAVSLLAGAATPVLVALLAWELQPVVADSRVRASVALFAGLAAAVAGHLWQSSIVAMSDTTAVAAATAGAWALARYSRTGSGRWLVAAGAALCFAVEVRVVYGLVAVLLAVPGLLALRRHARHRPRAAVLHVALAGLAALVVSLPALVPVLQALADGRPAPFVSTLGAFGWDPLSAFRAVHETPDGRLVYGIPTGLFYLLQPFQPYWFFGLGLLALPGAARVLRRPSAMLVAILLAWPVLALAFLAGIGQQNTRYSMLALPPLAVLISFGVPWLIEVARSQSVLARRLALAALTVAVVVNAGLAARFTDSFAARMVADSGAIRALVASVPPNARLVTLGPLAMLEHIGYPNVVDLNALDADPMRALLADGQPTYILVDLVAIERQWSERGAGRALATARADPGLEPIGSAGIWTLLRVRA